MNTYKKRLITALLCVANILGAEKKDALVCGGGSAESRPKSQEEFDIEQEKLDIKQKELDIKLTKAIIKHDYEALQEAVRQGANVNFQPTCKECLDEFEECDWDDRKHSYCRENLLKLAVEMKNAKAAYFILRNPTFAQDDLDLKGCGCGLLWPRYYENNPALKLVDNYVQVYSRLNDAGKGEYLDLKNVINQDEFTANDCVSLDFAISPYQPCIRQGGWQRLDSFYREGRSNIVHQIHEIAGNISEQKLTRVNNRPLDGMTLTLVRRLCLPQENTLTNLKNWQKSVFSSEDNISRKICVQNGQYRTPLSSMLKILSACKSVSSNLDQSGNQLVCQKPSFFQPCGQSQVHRFLRTELDEQNLKSLANTGCGFKKLVGPVCNKLRKIDRISEAFMPLAIETFSTIGALAPKPKDRCIEDFKDDPLVQAAIQNDPRIDRWEIGDLINRPDIGTKRPRSE
jgi:hypothetical protein